MQSVLQRALQRPGGGPGSGAALPAPGAIPRGSPRFATPTRASLGRRPPLRVVLIIVLALVTSLFLMRSPPHLRHEDFHPAAVLPKQCTAVQEARRKSGHIGLFWETRTQLYGRFAADFEARGLEALSGSAASQGMALTSLFDFDLSGKPVAKLQSLDVPVRAVVLPVPPASNAAKRMAEAAQTVLLPMLTDDGVWLQDPTIYHSSLYHASHHRDPKPAMGPEIDAEEAAIRAVFNDTCPVRAVVERVAVTPGGVVLVCWNVVGGGEPTHIRQSLRAALPHSPGRQLLSDEPILHTTLARIIKAPVGASTAADAAGVLKSAAWQLSRLLCGVEVEFSNAWFVEEFHALALALGGSYTPRTVPFSAHCQAGQDGGSAGATTSEAGGGDGTSTAAGGRGGGAATPPPRVSGAMLEQVEQVRPARRG